MAREEDLRMLKQCSGVRGGRKQWALYREAHDGGIDLQEANLRGANLGRFDLSEVDLSKALLVEAQMSYVNLTGANLAGCVARFARMSGAKLGGANLKGADLRGGSLRRADLQGADLEGAILRFTSLAEAKVGGANLKGAEIYGAAAWNLQGEPADQKGMLIRQNKDAIGTTVDDLDTAQLVSLLLDNPRIADVINTTSRRTVLLLGRFSSKRKKVLDAVKQHLLEKNFVPVLFDFRGPHGRDFTETVATLASLACFVVADLTSAKSLPQELSFIVPHMPSVPVIPILEEGEEVYSMFEHFQRYPWVRDIVPYVDREDLLGKFDREVIEVGWGGAMRSRGLDLKLPSPAVMPERDAVEGRDRGA